MMENAFYYLFFFLLGASVGSFLNMAIYRYREGINFLGRSFCDHCKRILCYVELIPVFSFIILRGRSLCCRKKLDYTLPIVEVVTGITFAIIFYKISRYPDLPAQAGILISSTGMVFLYKYIFLVLFLLLATILIFTFFYDLKYYEIPFKPIFFGYVIWVLNTVIQIFYYGNEPIISLQKQIDFFLNTNVLYNFSFALFTLLMFLFLFLVTKGRGMGFGDVYTAPLLSLIAGFPKSIVFLFSAFLIGAFYGVITILIGKNSLKSRVPFGPFLILGLVIALILGDDIISFYISYL